MSSETSDNVSSSDFENRIKRFRDQSQDYCNSLLNQRFLSSDKVNQKITNHYLTEYQRCVDEENRFESYLREQINTLESLKSCESTIDLFLQRLRNITEYEMKQNEVFEQILHELTKMNPSSKEERLELLAQLDQLIGIKSKLVHDQSKLDATSNKLQVRSSDTFKNILFSRWTRPWAIFAATGALCTTVIENDDKSLSDDEKSQSIVRQAQAMAQSYKEKQGIPGVSIGVTLHGSLLWKQGFGLADIEQHVPCTGDTVMRIASISKSFTSIIAARLVDAGKLKWDESIRTYRPDFKEFFFEKTPVTITVRQLASHTAGIRHYLKKGDKEDSDEYLLAEYYIKDPFPNVDDALRLFIDDELLHRPGSKWYYTTHGFTLLSAVLEGATERKQTFIELIDNLINKELGLRNTKLEYPNALVPNRSRYYWRKNLKEGLVHVNYVDLSYKWAGGGMLSNVGDLLIFANTLLQCQSKNFSGSKLISNDQLKELWSPVAGTNRKNTFYGLGWMICEEQKSPVIEMSIPRHIYHTGGAVGASSILLIIPCPKKCSNPNCGVCLALLTNLHCAGEIYQKALDIALLFHRAFPCINEKK